MNVLFEKDKDTICAISTPAGHGGIAVTRISGPKAFKISSELCTFLPKVPKSHCVYFGTLRSSVGEDIDEVLVTYFREGRSFTGEETVEISGHGGDYISKQVLSELVKLGCRHAEKGEFTFRSFMNGKLDLVQAESVLSLIESRSKSSAKLSLRQLKGGLSKSYSDIKDKLIWVGAHLEANIDYAFEDIVVESNDKLVEKIAECKASIEDLLESYDRGRLLNDGLQVAIIGRPNVGKSSLLNAICEETKAIVTDIPGTTRDIVEAEKLLNGYVVRFVDTAGLHTTFDKVELIGIERAKSAAFDSDVLLVVMDISQEFDEEIILNEMLKAADKRLFVLNKADCLNEQDKVGYFSDQIERVYPGAIVLTASAKTGLNIDRIEAQVLNFFALEESFDESLVTSGRHVNELVKIKALLVRVGEMLLKDESPEFIAFEIKEAVIGLSRILGEEYDDEIIDKVFREFCLGK